MLIKEIHSYSDELADLIGELLNELGEDWNREDLRISLVQSFKGEFFKVFGAWDDNQLVGTIGFFVTPELWNYQKFVAHEAFWYVKPRYRGMVGGKLLDYVETNLECDNITFGISDPRLLKLILRRGYKVEKTIVSKLLE